MQLHLLPGLIKNLDYGNWTISCSFFIFFQIIIFYFPLPDIVFTLFRPGADKIRLAVFLVHLPEPLGKKGTRPNTDAVFTVIDDFDFCHINNCKNHCFKYFMLSAFACFFLPSPIPYPTYAGSSTGYTSGAQTPEHTGLYTGSEFL